jgi:hypothetical protein
MNFQEQEYAPPLNPVHFLIGEEFPLRRKMLSAPDIILVGAKIK